MLIDRNYSRKVGIILALVFAVIALNTFSIPYSALCLFLLLLALIYPDLLRPVAKLWLLLSEVLAKITNPVIMGLMFFLILSPLSIALRLFGRDILRLKPKKNELTYWISKDKSESTTFRDSF